MTFPEGQFVQGDTTGWVFVLDDKDGNPVDLTGATVRCHMQRAITLRPLVFDQPAVVDQSGVSPNFVNKGQVHYDPRPQDVSVAGDFLVEFDVTQGGRTLTYPQGRPVHVRIRPQMA